MEPKVVQEEFVDRLEAQWRANAEATGVETQELEGEIILIRKMMKQDAEFFIEFFLTDQLDMAVPEFHKEIWGLLTDTEKERILLAIPRDHAKTTLAKLVVIWYWLHTKHRFCVYLSNTAPIAKGACRDIIEFLDNANFIKVYGKIRMIKQSENEGLWIFDLPLQGGGWKRCVLRGLGQGQQMRGINIDNQRPDIAVVDDVEDNENTESSTQQSKLDRWMFGPFIKALARQKKIIWLGNMLSKTSLLARLSRSPKWNPVVYGSLVKCTATGQLEPLWPGKWTVDALQEDFAEYRDNGLVETWMCEMMNMPGHGENGFTADQIFYQPMPTPDSISAAWLSIDPAFGLNAHNDETAISVHVIPKESGIPMTVASVHGHFDDVRKFEEALGVAEYWGAWVWGIEAVAAQRVLISLFNVLAVMRGYGNRIEFIPLMAGRGDPKMGRMRAFVSLMASKDWALAESDIDITQQILSLDMRLKEQKDDIVDSAAYGPAMMEQFMPFIQEAYNAGGFATSGDAVYGMEVAGV